MKWYGLPIHNNDSYSFLIGLLQVKRTFKDELNYNSLEFSVIDDSPDSRKGGLQLLLRYCMEWMLWKCIDQLRNKTIHKCDVQFYIQYQYAHGACKWNAIHFFSIKCVSIRKRISRFRVDNSLENI